MGGTTRADDLAVVGSPASLITLCGVPIHTHSVESAAAAVIDLAQEQRPARVHLCNSHVLGEAARDPSYADLLAEADLNLPDGLPVALTARRLGVEAAERVPGAELFVATARAGVPRGLKHYLYGSTTDVLEQLVEALQVTEPAVEIVAAEAPPFRALTDDEFHDLCRRIAASGADVVWVGLGTPKQDHLMARLHREGVEVVTVAVGAAFDFLSGVKQRAPEWMQRSGLEWLHRLGSEPTRLWRRYLIGNAVFLKDVWPTRELVSFVPRSRAPRGVRPSVRIRRWLVVADVLVITVSTLLAYFLRLSLGESGALKPLQDDEIPVVLAVLPLWLSILWSFGCYRAEFQNQSSEAFRRYLGAIAVCGLSLGFVSFAFRVDLARLYVAGVVSLTLALGTLVRSLLRRRLRHVRGRGEWTRRVLLVGTDDESRRVAEAMTSYRVAGYEVVGFVSDETETGDSVAGLPVVGTTDAILDLATDHDVEMVVLSPSALPAGTLQNVTVALEDSDVKIAVAPSLFEVVTRRVVVESVANVPILHVDQIRLEGWKLLTKRVFDLVVSVGLGLVATPIALAAAVAIKLDDGGPVLFVQRRVGRDGGIFRLYKFRTMVPDAEDRLRELQTLNEAGHHFFKIRQDPRVTRVGRILRKWSIDELPQIFNVFRGDMSMVGPRPPIPAEVAQYEPWHRRRLRVRPGVTGVWQVSGRSNVDFDEAVRLDLFYIENWSLAYDIFLVAKTVPAVLGRDGAY